MCILCMYGNRCVNIVTLISILIIFSNSFNIYTVGIGTFENTWAWYRERVLNILLWLSKCVGMDRATNLSLFQNSL